jgi:hypothetical protein
MPIEIKELIIQALIGGKGHKSKKSAPQKTEELQKNIADIIARAFKTNQER